MHATGPSPGTFNRLSPSVHTEASVVRVTSAVGMIGSHQDRLEGVEEALNGGKVVAVDRAQQAVDPVDPVVTTRRRAGPGPR